MRQLHPFVLIILGSSFCLVAPKQSEPLINLVVLATYLSLNSNAYIAVLPCWNVALDASKLRLQRVVMVILSSLLTPCPGWKMWLSLGSSRTIVHLF